MDASSLPYHEPSIIQILILSSFSLLLNLINWVLERSIYCGLVGQILIGVFWGTPLGGWLESSIETAVVQLGYLGLILLVYEGGLSTSLAPLLSNLPISVAVATTGILLPIGLSFILMAIVPGTTPLQSFAAGAALSATSLGTTFSILTSSGFAKTRLGTVLTSAAMMDDVIGLVMIQVVAELGSGAISGGTIGRPVGASFGLLLFVVLGCRWVIRPLHHRFLSGKKEEPIVEGNASRMAIKGGDKVFLIHSGILIALVTGASYAGTSVLFAAFLAGAAISWWDMMAKTSTNTNTGTNSTPSQPPSPWTGTHVYEHYYAPPTTRLLIPFFFASIGFSIPITKLFKSTTVWRGITYAILMAVGKFMTGVWLLRFTAPRVLTKLVSKIRIIKKLGRTETTNPQPDTTTTTTTNPNLDPNPNPNPAPAAAPAPAPAPAPITPTSTIQPVQKPRSLYPPAIIGLAMIARGEIGFLIASVAEARGIFAREGEDSGGSSELYLIVIWATVLCTILGPVCVGLLVRRVKELENERIEKGLGGTGVLGSWGVESEVVGS